MGIEEVLPAVESVVLAEYDPEILIVFRHAILLPAPRGGIRNTPHYSLPDCGSDSHGIVNKLSIS
jgi:hypothetical protein